MSVNNGITVTGIQKKSTRCRISFKLTTPESYKVYDNIDICMIPASIRPISDAYYYIVYSSTIGVVIVYASGNIRLRYMLNPPKAGTEVDLTAFWDIIK